MTEREGQTLSEELGTPPPGRDPLARAEQKQRLLAQMFGVEQGPEQLRHYTLIRELGRGGMGVVYEAEDRKLERRVAIKTLTTSDHSVLRKRLIREAKAMAKLDHPNVVRVFEIDEVEGSTYIVMEFVDGQTLGDWLAERPRALVEIVEAIRAAGRGLAAIHDAGLVHRDVKPDNIMVDARGHVRVMDLGIVGDDASVTLPSGEQTDAEIDARERPVLDGASESLTRTGAMIGSPAYMAPEQFEARAITPRTDQFSLCVTLWEAIYGERPFWGRDVSQLMNAVIHGRRREPEVPAPAWVRRVLDRGLQLRPKDRFESMTALVDALDPPRRRASAPLIAAGSLAIVGLGLGLWLIADAPTGAEPAVIEPRPAEPPTGAPANAKSASLQRLAIAHEAEEIEFTPDGALIYSAAGGLFRFDPATEETSTLHAIDGIGRLQVSADGAILYAASPTDGIGSGSYRIEPGGGAPRLSEWRFRVYCALPRAGLLLSVHPAAGHALEFRGVDGGALEQPIPSLALADAFSFQFHEQLACDDHGGRAVIALIDGKTTTFVLLEDPGDGGAWSTRPIYADDNVTLQRFSATGERLYFLVDRGFGRQLEALSLDERGIATPLGVVLPDVETSEIGVLPDDRVGYRTVDHEASLVVLEPGQRALEHARRVLDLSSSESSVFDISRSGDWLAWVERRGTHGRIMAAPVAGGETTELVPFARQISALRWSDDGRRLAWVAESEGRARLWTIEREGGEATVHPTSISPPGQMTWTLDGRVVVQQPGNQNFAVLDPNTETERPLLRELDGWPFHPQLSPVGDRVALWWNRASDDRLDGMWTVGLDDGEAVLVDAGHHEVVGWSDDGEWLYMVEPEQPWLISRTASRGGGALEPWLNLDFGRYRDESSCEVLAGGRLSCLAIELRDVGVWVREVEVPSPG